MKNKKQIIEAKEKIEKFERMNGNKNLKSSRISPRRQGKLRALSWVLEETDLEL